MHQRTARLAGVRVTPTSDRTRRLMDLIKPSVDEPQEGATGHAGLGWVRTGIVDVDAATGSFRPGELVVMAGRPGSGCEELTTSLVLAAVEDQIPTVWISPGRPAESLVKDLLCARASIQRKHMRLSVLDDQEYAKLARILADVAEAHLYVNDASVQTPATIAQCVLDLELDRPPLIVVSDLQQLAADIDGPNLYESAAGVIRALKVLARDLGAVVVATSGLNRGVEQRTDKVPTVWDLRGAGDIEEVADHILLTSNPSYYDVLSERLGEVDIMVAKTSIGLRVTVVAAHQIHFGRVVNMHTDA